MLKLLNRFAWLIAFTIGIQISFFVDNDGPFDDQGFWFFLIALFIVRFLFISNKFIESRLEFFANSLNLRKTAKNNVASSVMKHEKVEKIKEKEPTIDLVDYQVNYYEDNDNSEVKDEVRNEVKFESKKIKEEEPSKVEIYIKQFFSENILAKLGAILVFLGVLFLMSLIWNEIPSVGKIIIGFVIGFGTYFSGVILDNKGYTGESRILIGAGILINYLVILAGKHLIGDNFGEGTGLVLGTGVAFMFLILNTVFAIYTSFIYKSRTLLLFSFIFAYLNPLLVGGSSDTPYLLIGYSMIVSLGALFIGYKNNDEILKYGAFILGNMLFLIAPISYNLSASGHEIAWIVKMLFTGVLGFLSLLTFYKNESKSISTVFILNYIFIILQLFGGGDIGVLGSSISFITYMISILLFFGVGIWLFLMESLKSITAIVTFPVLIVLGILFTGGLNFLAPALGIVVLTYLIGFNFLGGIVSSYSKYFFFIILGGFIFAFNSFISFGFFASIHNDIIINFNTFLTSVIVSFVFLFTSYYFSRRENQEFLYSIGTIGGILTLIPVITVSYIIGIPTDFNTNIIQSIPQSIINLSIISVIIFTISNQLLPFINLNLISKLNNLKNLITGSIFGVLFIGFELFMFGNRYFQGIALGFAFVFMAIIYFILGFLMMEKLGMNEVKKELTPKNTILSYLFISISLLSIAIALIFSNNPEIISTIWLFEATILFYFFSKTKEDKIFTVGIILFLVGIFKMFGLLDIVKSKEFLFLVPFSIIFISLILNLKFLNLVESGVKRISHDILHIIGIGILGSLLFVIIPSTGHGWSILGISIFIFLIGIIYSYFNSKILKYFYIIIFVFFMIMHLDGFDGIIRKIDRDNLGYLRILQYISTVIIGLLIIGWNKLNKFTIINNTLNFLISIYLFFIVSNYILDIFEITFAVTIFWGIVSSILLFYGISLDKIKYRTIGLYLLSLVLIKIFGYDIWNGIDDAVTRVIAFIGIGILLIIISTRYTKKYGNNLKGEFSLSNLTDEVDLKETNSNKNSDKIIKKNNNKTTTKKTIEKEFEINQKIENIDIGNIKSVEFIFAGRNIKIRAINLIKIVKLIIDNFDGKTSFKPLELQKVYDYIKDNYKSDLSKDNYDKIIEILDGFVMNGGDVNLIEK